MDRTDYTPEYYADRAAHTLALARKAVSNVNQCCLIARAEKHRADANAALARADSYCVTAYRLSVTALRHAHAAAELSRRGNTHTCAAATDAAQACECASQAARYRDAAD